MNKQIEALKMAITQMRVYAMQHENEWMIKDAELEEAIQACKEALAEAEKQEWQSLSDDEIDEIWVKSFGSSEIVHNLDFARAIEQALKEKNHG